MGSSMNVHEMYHVVANGLSSVLSLPEEALERQFGIKPSEVQELRLFLANAGVRTPSKTANVETALALTTPLPPDRQEDSMTLPSRAKNPWSAVKGLVHATSFLATAVLPKGRSPPLSSSFNLSGRWRLVLSPCIYPIGIPFTPTASHVRLNLDVARDVVLHQPPGDVCSSSVSPNTDLWAAMAAIIQEDFLQHVHEDKHAWLESLQCGDVVGMLHKTGHLFFKMRERKR
jgi:hypothetical protein